MSNKKHMKMILTSFQDFPCARRGYTGAFGLMKVTLFECAMSFGCSNMKNAHSYLSWYTKETENGKKFGSITSDLNDKTQSER